MCFSHLIYCGVFFTVCLRQSTPTNLNIYNRNVNFDSHLNRFIALLRLLWSHWVTLPPDVCFRRWRKSFVTIEQLIKMNFVAVFPFLETDNHRECLQVAHGDGGGGLMYRNDGGLEESRNFPLPDMRRNFQGNYTNNISGSFLLTAALKWKMAANNNQLPDP